MSKSLSVTFRVPAELVESFTNAVSESGTDKTTWLIDAIRHKLSQPDSNPDHRMIALVERMETAAAALIGGKQGIPPHPYNEAAVLQVVAGTIKQGFDNGRVIAQRINEAGYQTRAGKAWDKDIYSAWKRQKDTATKIAALLEYDDIDIADRLPEIEASLRSGSVVTPNWVKSGADYIRWVKSITSYST